MAAKKFTPSEQQMNHIIEVFHQYSQKSPDALEKTEFEELVEKQAPGYHKYMKENNISLETLFKQIDLDKNKKMTFPEFVLVLSKIAIEIHDRYHKDKGPEGSGHHGHGYSHHHHH
ncbi:protein S100-A12-like [Macrotis lagotis]|uniref:protein S100-A12-like n=1 Tax=Macrotis lagotis TaxID=92651 RepID=UPI003D69E32A